MTKVKIPLLSIIGVLNRDLPKLADRSPKAHRNVISSILLDLDKHYPDAEYKPDEIHLSQYQTTYLQMVLEPLIKVSSGDGSTPVNFLNGMFSQISIRLTENRVYSTLIYPLGEDAPIDVLRPIARTIIDLKDKDQFHLAVAYSMYMLAIHVLSDVMPKEFLSTYHDERKELRC